MVDRLSVVSLKEAHRLFCPDQLDSSAGVTAARTSMLTPVQEDVQDNASSVLIIYN
jgi:hypothetical protein